MATLPPLAEVTDLEVRLGETLTGSDATRAGAVLADVSAHARSESGRAWVADDGATLTVPDDVGAIVLAASRRAYLNPDQYASEQSGDYSYRIPAEIINGGVFTDAELKQLRRYRNASGLWSLRVSGGDELRTIYYDVEGGGDPIPWFSTDDPVLG